MARYVNDIVLNQPEDFVKFIMEDYLNKNNFTMSEWKKKEPAYRAGDAMVEGYKYLKWSYVNGTLHLEAWLRGTFGGEMPLEGFVAALMKKPYKESLEQLIEVLKQPVAQNGTDSNPYISNVAQTIKVDTVDNHKAATSGLILGILSVIGGFIIPIAGFIFATLGFSRSRMGIGSSKASLAKAGRICSTIGFVVSISIWIYNIFFAVSSTILF